MPTTSGITPAGGEEFTAIAMLFCCCCRRRRRRLELLPAPVVLAERTWRRFNDCVPPKLVVVVWPTISGDLNDDDDAAVLSSAVNGERNDDDLRTGDEFAVVDGDH